MRTKKDQQSRRTSWESSAVNGSSRDRSEDDGGCGAESHDGGKMQVVIVW